MQDVEARNPDQARSLGAVLRALLPALEELSLVHNSQYFESDTDSDHYEHVIASFAGVNADVGLRKLHLELDEEMVSPAHIAAIASLLSLQSLCMLACPLKLSLSPLTALPQLQHLNTDHQGPFPSELLARLHSITVCIRFCDIKPLVFKQGPVYFPHLHTITVPDVQEDTDFKDLLALFSLHDMPCLKSVCFGCFEHMSTGYKNVAVDTDLLDSCFEDLPDPPVHVTFDYVAENFKNMLLLLQSIHKAKKCVTINEMDISFLTPPANSQIAQLAALVPSSSLQKGVTAVGIDACLKRTQFVSVVFLPLLVPPMNTPLEGSVHTHTVSITLDFHFHCLGDITAKTAYHLFLQGSHSGSRTAPSKETACPAC